MNLFGILFILCFLKLSFGSRFWKLSCPCFSQNAELVELGLHLQFFFSFFFCQAQNYYFALDNIV